MTQWGTTPGAETHPPAICCTPGPTSRGILPAIGHEVTVAQPKVCPRAFVTTYAPQPPPPPYHPTYGGGGWVCVCVCVCLCGQLCCGDVFVPIICGRPTQRMAPPPLGQRHRQQPPGGIAQRHPPTIRPPPPLRHSNHFVPLEVLTGPIPDRYAPPPPLASRRPSAVHTPTSGSSNKCVTRDVAPPPPMPPPAPWGGGGGGSVVYFCGSVSQKAPLPKKKSAARPCPLPGTVVLVTGDREEGGEGTCRGRRPEGGTTGPSLVLAHVRGSTDLLQPRAPVPQTLGMRQGPRCSGAPARERHVTAHGTWDMAGGERNAGPPGLGTPSEGAGADCQGNARCGTDPPVRPSRSPPMCPGLRAPDGVRGMRAGPRGGGGCPAAHPGSTAVSPAPASPGPRPRPCARESRRVAGARPRRLTRAPAPPRRTRRRSTHRSPPPPGPGAPCVSATTGRASPPPPFAMRSGRGGRTRRGGSAARARLPPQHTHVRRPGP